MSTGSTQVLAPNGCTSIQMDSDGTSYAASKSGVIDVPDRYLPELRASNAYRNGFISDGRSFSIGTRVTRRCDPCKRNWQAWSVECPKCGKPTTITE